MSMRAAGYFTERQMIVQNAMLNVCMYVCGVCVVCVCVCVCVERGGVGAVMTHKARSLKAYSDILSCSEKREELRRGRGPPHE